MGEAKKCKKELSFDTVALSGGFFYPELHSTIVRMVWPPLSTIKSVSDTLRVFYLPTRAIEIFFNLRTACRQPPLGRSCMLFVMLGAQELYACAGGCSGSSSYGGFSLPNVRYTVFRHCTTATRRSVRSPGPL